MWTWYWKLYSNLPLQSNLYLIPQGLPIHSFTTKFPVITNVLITDVHITKAFYPDKKEKPQELVKLKALWDTGATGSVIIQKVISECNLQPIGMTIVNTASGQNRCPVFLIAMGLPNNVLFNEVRVTLGKLSGNIDVLIGMDIIQSGDFAITNLNGKTVFSFRLPSTGLIDFVQEQKDAEPKLGRNDPCYCGSGKKYKHCHGKN